MSHTWCVRSLKPLDRKINKSHECSRIQLIDRYSESRWIRTKPNESMVVYKCCNSKTYILISHPFFKSTSIRKLGFLNYDCHSVCFLSLTNPKVILKIQPPYSKCLVFCVCHFFMTVANLGLVNFESHFCAYLWAKFDSWQLQIARLRQASS